MSAKQFDRLREVLVGLRDISQTEQAAYLDRECAGDADLRNEVESLLGFDSAAPLPAIARTGGVRELIQSSSPQQPPGASVPGRIGPFEVLGELGRGGMGIVLRARDTRLRREVALKILPEAFAGHPERLARFGREAHLLAALNHPNIAQIYGLERLDGTSALVMELVEGKSLAERIAAGPVGLRETLGIARQVAEAVEAAHERGIVHRDLKPANIMVGPRGRVKVLDFGLAKVLDPENAEPGNGEPTERAGSSYRSATAQEFILGTPAYMSPEQLRRRAVTRRADVWAFGCICFELLTGHAAFGRGNLLDTAMAVLGAAPDWSLLPEATPTPLRTLLRRCLHKDEHERLRDLGDVRILLDEMVGDDENRAQPLPAVKSASRRRWLLVIAASLAAFAAGMGLAPRFSEAPPEPYSLRELTTSGHDGLPAVSPDQRRIALASDRDGRARIWLKELSTGAEQAITEGDDSLPQFSPDGSSLLFVRAENGGQNAYRQALLGGHPLKVMDGVLEACWSPDGESIAFVRQRRPIGNLLAMVPARGGTETLLYESPRLLYGARWSPRKNEIVVIEGPPSGKPAGYNLIFINPDSEHPADQARRLPVSGPISAPAWTGGGRRLLYAQAGSTLGDYGDPLSRIVLHDLDTARKTTVFFAEGLFPTITQWTLGRVTSLGVVGRGSVVFGKTDVLQGLREAPLVDIPTRKPVPRGGRRDRQPVYSPDGEQLVFSSDRTGNLDLWLFDFRRDELRRLTDDAAQDWDPAFTPDGRSVLWSSDRTGHLEIWGMDLDGGAMKQVTRDGENAENPTATPDRTWVIYSSANPAKSGIWRIRPDGTDAVQLLAGPYTIPETSPDGRWATFRRQEPANWRTVIGVLEIATGKVMPCRVTVPWPAAGAERLVLGRTRWLADGKAFAYLGVDDRKRSGIYVQDYDPDGNVEATRRVLAGFNDDFTVESFALTRDGRYVMMSTKTTEQSIQIAKGVPEVEPVAVKEH